MAGVQMNDDAESFLLRRFLGPALALLVLLACVLAGLSLELRMPIGPGYQELAALIDASARIGFGQVPAIDFSPPAGALGLYLFHFGQRLFPSAHPLLIAQWAPLVLTLPLMLCISADVARRSAATALALVLPFLLFSLLPFNLLPSRGALGPDAAGITGRQAAAFAYVLAAGLLFARNPFVLALVGAVATSALFFLGPFAFLAGFLLITHAILAGRIRWGVLLFLLLGLYAAVGGAEYASGHVVVWLQDMLLRAQADGERLALAYLRELSVEFRLIAAAIVLAVVLFWLERRRLSAQYEESRMYHGAIRALNGWFNAPAPWLASAILAALLLDPLCVGGHGAIVLWPALWRIIEETPAQPARRRLAVLALAGAVALPAVTGLLHGAARSALALPASLPVPFEHLGRLGNVLATPEQSQRAAILAGHHARHRRAYMDLAEAGASDLQRALDPVLELAWLGELDRLAGAVLAWERDNGRQLASMVTLDRADPLPALLGREPLKGIDSGTDIEARARRLSTRVLHALDRAEAIFLPRCPETRQRLAYRTAALQALTGRRAIEITPCYTMMLKRDAAAR